MSNGSWRGMTHLPLIPKVLHRQDGELRLSRQVLVAQDFMAFLVKKPIPESFRPAGSTAFVPLAQLCTFRDLAIVIQSRQVNNHTVAANRGPEVVPGRWCAPPEKGHWAL